MVWWKENQSNVELSNRADFHCETAFICATLAHDKFSKKGVGAISQDQNKILLWSEEFGDYANGSLSPEIWSFDYGDGAALGLVGWGNNELEYYTSDSVSIDGNLIIEATRLEGETELECYYGPAQWKSGKIHTARKVGFKYGLLEIKAKMPSGAGTWPALWLLGNNLHDGVVWPNCGEIDILENTGMHPNQVQGTIHADGYFGENGLTKIIQAQAPLSEAFHTYGISWDEHSIEWLFDGNSYNKIWKDDVTQNNKSWPFDQDFYLIINLAIGGWFGGEVDPHLQSAELVIDSIKFYSRDGVGKLILY